MASVQELLLAANAKKSPFLSLLEGAAQGFGNAQQNALENAKTLMTMDIARQEEQRKQEEFARVKAYRSRIDDELKASLNTVGGAPDPVMPRQKLSKTVTMDEKGNPSVTYKTEASPDKTVSYQESKYLDDAGKNRIGRFNPSTGKLEKSPDDALAPISVSAPGQGVRGANDLRKEFNSLSKDFFQVNESVSRIRASASDPSGAGDLALIFNYMKILDPGSTVREGEFATAAASAGLPDRMIAAAKKLDNGERLSDDQRKDFVDRAEKLFENQRAVHERRKASYTDLAVNMGIDPKLVLIDNIIDKAPTDQPKTDKKDPAGKKDPSARFDEIVNSGKSEEEAYKILAQEGY